jgi:hypothetical protein
MHAPAPSRPTRRRLSRARATRRAAAYRCQITAGRRPCGSASSGMSLVEGRQVAACAVHLPGRTGRPGHALAARDSQAWARVLLDRLRRDRTASSDDSE